MKKQTKILIAGVLGILILFKFKDLFKKDDNTQTPPNTPPNQSGDYKINFINKIKEECKQIGENLGIPYKFLIAQLILESGWGRSTLFTKYNNIAGIKAVKGQNFISLPTNEYIKGKKVRLNQNFAVYSSVKEGIEAYAKVLQNKYFKGYLNKTTNPEEYAELLQSGKIKYATDINYVAKIKQLLKYINTII